MKLYSLQEAADELAPVITFSWLKHHIKDLPHLRAGKGRGRAGRIGFTADHLREIVAMCESRPTETASQSTVVTRRGPRPKPPTDAVEQEQNR